ncbi:MAG: hypothetical protein AAF798_04415 [Bacteroidota bacterium]
MSDTKINWWNWIILAIFLLVAFRFFVFARMAILIGLAAAVVGIFGYVAWQALAQRRKAKDSRVKSLNAIQQRIDYCEDQLVQLKAEVAEIKADLRDLQLQKRKNSSTLNTTNKKDTERLLAAFEGELLVRLKKQSFFETCLQKLNRLYANQELSADLAEKQERLRKLQENHYEDLAEMEALRSDMELDVFYLDTIESLSEKMLLTNSSSEAEALQLELEKMTRSLDDL